MKLSSEFLLFIISCGFALLGIFNYFMADHVWPLLWICSFISLLGCIGIDQVERLVIDRRVEQILNDEGAPPYLRRQTD